MSRQVKFLLQGDTELRSVLVPAGPRQVHVRVPLLHGASTATPVQPPLSCPYLASRARAMMPAARGAEADVPVCSSVHFCLRSVVTCEEECQGRKCCRHIPPPEPLACRQQQPPLTICFSFWLPLLYVVARVEEQASLYQGTLPYCVVLLMDSV